MDLSMQTINGQINNYSTQVENKHLVMNPVSEKNKILASLSPEVLERLKDCMKPVNLMSGTTIYYPEASIDYVYFPESCVASRLSLLEDGSTVEIGIIGNEGIIGITSFVGAALAHNWTVVEVSGSAYRLSTRTFLKKLKEENELRSAIANYYNQFFMQVSQLAVCRSRHTLMEQFCLLLLMIKDRISSEQMHITHEAIARRLGTRRAGITVAANQLRKEKVIDYTRGHIILRDRRKLEDFACECYGAQRANEKCTLSAEAA